MKRNIKVIIIFIVLIALFSSLYYIKRGTVNFYKTRFNMIKKDNYFYFVYEVPSSDKSIKYYIIKMSEDKKEIKPLISFSDSITELSLYNNKLYFVNHGDLIYSMNLDGTNAQNLSYLGGCNYYIYKDNIYYENSYSVLDKNLYCASIKENAELSNQKRLINKISHYCIFNNKIYASSYLSNKRYEVNEYNMEGKFIKKICVIENRNFYISSGCIIYIPFDYELNYKGESNLKNSPVYSINIKSGRKVKIVKDDNVFYIIANKDKVYCLSIKDGESSLYITDTFGKGKKKVFNNFMDLSHMIDGENIYYVDEGSFKSCRIGEKDSKELVRYDKIRETLK